MIPRQRRSRSARGGTPRIRIREFDEQSRECYQGIVLGPKKRIATGVTKHPDLPAHLARVPGGARAEVGNCLRYNRRC